ERHRGLVNGLLERSRGTADFVALVKRFDLDVKADEILEVMERHAAESAGAEAVRLLLDRGHGEVLAARARDGDVARAMRAVRAMGNARDRRLLPVLVALAGDGERDLDVVGQAVRALARTKRGAESLLRVAESGRLPDEVKPVAAVALASSPWGELRLRAASLLPPPPSKDNRPLPPVADLVRREGESTRGAAHFEKLCMNCHRAKGRGKEFGPDLSEIGDKLGKDALFVSILDPNAGISFNYEGVELTLATGDVVVGIVVSETDALLTLQSAGGIVTEYAKTKVLERRRLNRSIMPTDLQRNLTAQELVDLVEYLARLRR
ncbi:MAG: c-type cytochrome, partial [Planctomycetota bacterium]|nr:c-type cytochrome [Planctomycetota bacterium]